MTRQYYFHNKDTIMSKTVLEKVFSIVNSKPTLEDLRGHPEVIMPTNRDLVKLGIYPIGIITSIIPVRNAAVARFFTLSGEYHYIEAKPDEFNIVVEDRPSKGSRMSSTNPNKTFKGVL